MATINGTLTLTGTFNGTPLNGSAGYSQSISIGAAEFAQQGNSSPGGFTLIPPAVTVAGQGIRLHATYGGGYHGPGQYGKDTLISAGVGVADGEGDYQVPDWGTIDLTVNADGSGTLTFAGWVNVNNEGDTLAGSVVWTCH